MIARAWLAGMLLAVSAAAQATGVKLVISSPKSEYYLGEMIPLNVAFTSAGPQSFAADTMLRDRIGRMNYAEEFVVEPASNVEDPLHGLPQAQGGMGGLSGGPTVLSELPFQFERVLNEWVRFRQPGEYRVHVISHRVSRAEDLAKRLDVVSNTLTLRILPAPPEWVSEQIALTRSAGDAKAEERLHAMQVLRYLESPAATAELVRRLSAGQDVDAYGAYLGLMGTAHRKLALPMMEERLVAADQPVWDRYLYTRVTLADLAANGEMPTYPKDPVAQATWRKESERRASFRTQKQSEYIARLVAALPAKQPEARAISLQTLLNLGSQHGIAEALVADFRSLPATSQVSLLESRWDMLKGPALLPVLRDLLADRQTQDVALRRLNELAPDEARKIILEEIRHPTRYLPFTTLAMLPDVSLPELNEVLAERGDPPLVLRYANGDILQPVKEKYLAHRAEVAKQNLPDCAGPLAFYFMKYDPPFGESLLRADFARTGAPPACYDVGFQFLSLGKWAYSPALEKLAIESLNSDKVPVKRGAAEVLGKYGSAAAEKPLWETMEYFRAWWKGRESQLNGREGEESRQLERALWTALSQGSGWTLPPSDLRRLLDLCSSDWCRQEVTARINAGQTR
jgi:hypothetical protein